MPDLGVPGAKVSVWFVRPGERLREGERLVEVLAGSAAVDVPSPSDGILVQRLVEIDHPVQPGQTLGFVDDSL
jgi:pyruvate/2-oxoglutarate dehydrogenase complex dihydrolipoamide acyltransferase (E2) component